MSKATIRIPTPLRSFTGGADELTVDADTVGQALGIISDRHRGLAERVLDAEGKLRTFVNLYVGPKNVKSLQGLDTPIKEGDVLSIVPAVAGGAR